MISPEQQQLDEALAAANHSENCGAFEMGQPCSGPPVCEGGPVPGVVQGGPRVRVVPAVKLDSGLALAEPSITLVGQQARALAEYQDAARVLKAATAQHQAASERFRVAHQAFADAMAS